MKPLARERVRSLLSDEPDVEVVAECVNGSQTLRATQEHGPDLLFLDVQIPRLNGFEDNNDRLPSGKSFRPSR